MDPVTSMIVRGFLEFVRHEYLSPGRREPGRTEIIDFISRRGDELSRRFVLNCSSSPQLHPEQVKQVLLGEFLPFLARSSDRIFIHLLQDESLLERVEIAAANRSLGKICTIGEWQRLMQSISKRERVEITLAALGDWNRMMKMQLQLMNYLVVDCQIDFAILARMRWANYSLHDRTITFGPEHRPELKRVVTDVAAKGFSVWRSCVERSRKLSGFTHFPDPRNQLSPVFFGGNGLTLLEHGLKVDKESGFDDSEEENVVQFKKVQAKKVPVILPEDEFNVRRKQILDVMLCHLGIPLEIALKVALEDVGPGCRSLSLDYGERKYSLVLTNAGEKIQELKDAMRRYFSWLRVNYIRNEQWAGMSRHPIIVSNDGRPVQFELSTPG